MELEFLKLEFHFKLKFHKLKFQKGGRLLNISQIVVKKLHIFPNSGIWPFWPCFLTIE